MISILLNWLYMSILVLVTGVALMQGYLCLMKKINKSVEKTVYNVGHILFAGILGTTLYAQIFSLFYRVNLEANIVLVIILAAYVIWQRKYISQCIKHGKEEIAFLGKGRWILWGLIFAAVIAFALSSAGPAKLIDTDWYHAQTIRWIEEYGCVKGVANLFYTLGFNNAQHYFDALFSMKCFIGQSLRGTGGFFGLIIFIHGLLRVCRWKQHSHHMADILAVWEVVYSIIVTAFFADPYVDTLPNILVLFILTEWFALLEEKSEDTVWYGFYCLLAVFAVVCKTSVAMIVFLTIYPVCLFIKQKKAVQIPVYLFMGFCITVPFLITNVITTGYMVYLFSALDLFDVPWKIDPSVLKYSVDNMVAFARMPSASMDEALNCGLAWVSDWWSRESVSHQILYIAIVVFAVFDLVYTVICLLRRKIVDYVLLLPRICVYAGLVYWFFTIPQVKYCWAFLIFPVAVVPVYYMERMEKKTVARVMVVISLGLLLMYGGFYSLRTLGYMKESIVNYPVMQKDYENHVFNTVEINGHTFYTKIDNGDIVCGYYIFPYIDNKDDIDRLVVGESLGEGFYFEKTNE